MTLMHDMQPPIDLQQLLKLPQIPSMGGWSAALPFYWLAYNLEGHGCVVECGTWLGSGLAAVICGLRDARSTTPVHVFDVFMSWHEQIWKAKPYGVELEDEQDLLPLIRQNVPEYKDLHFHRGYVKECEWEPEKIELYIDDCNKTEEHFVPCMRKFSPHWIPGITTVVLMDYHFDEDQRWDKEPMPVDEKGQKLYQAQKRFIARHQDSFESIGRLSDSNGGGFWWTSIEFFRFVKHIEFTEEELAIS